MAYNSCLRVGLRASEERPPSIGLLLGSAGRIPLTTREYLCPAYILTESAAFFTWETVSASMTSLVEHSL